MKAAVSTPVSAHNRANRSPKLPMTSAAPAAARPRLVNGAEKRLFPPPEEAITTNAAAVKSNGVKKAVIAPATSPSPPPVVYSGVCDVTSPFLRFTKQQIDDFFREPSGGDRLVFRKAAVAVAVCGNFRTLMQVKQIKREDVTRKPDGSYAIETTDGVVVNVVNGVDQATSPAAKVREYLDLLRGRGVKLKAREPLFGAIRDQDLGLVGAEVAEILKLRYPDAYDERSFQLHPEPQAEVCFDHDYGTASATTTATASSSSSSASSPATAATTMKPDPDANGNVEDDDDDDQVGAGGEILLPVPDVVIKEEVMDCGTIWPSAIGQICQEEIVCTTAPSEGNVSPANVSPGGATVKVEPHPDEVQVISFLDSLIANKKQHQVAAAAMEEEAVAISVSGSHHHHRPGVIGLAKEVGSVAMAGVAYQDKVVPKMGLVGVASGGGAAAAENGIKVEPPSIVNGVKRPGTVGGGGGVMVVCAPGSGIGVQRQASAGNPGPKVQLATTERVTPQNSTLGSITAKFVDGEFSQSYEQTDCRINEVVGMELVMDSDPSSKRLYGTVNIYLVHSHELFLRDIIDAKGHQGVKDDTDAMRDYPLRAWVANGNGSEEYKLLPTKVHGDVKAVTVNLQGENKINLLFTVLSTDQGNFGRNHKAKLWSLEIVGEVNRIPVKISIPVQVVACLRNPKKLKRSKRRLDGFNRAVKHFKADTSDAQQPIHHVVQQQQQLTAAAAAAAAANGIPSAAAVVLAGGPPSATTNSSAAAGSTIAPSTLQQLPHSPHHQSATNAGAMMAADSSASASCSSRSLSADSGSGLVNGNGCGVDNGNIIEEILRLQAEYLEKLPTPILAYELAKARALANSKMFSE